MRSQQRALNSYGSVQVVTGVASANNVQLIQMLFDGLIESLAKAKGHMIHGTIKEKSDALGRAGRIVVGLQVPPKDNKAFAQFLATLGYPHVEETQNPAYRLFLRS